MRQTGLLPPPRGAKNNRRAASLGLRFAGVVVEVECASAAWLDLVRGYFGGFCSHEPAEVHIQYRLTTPEEEEDSRGVGSPLNHCRLTAWEGGFDLDGDSFRAGVRLREGLAWAEGPLSLAPLLALLRFLLPALVANGFVVHAAALAGTGGGWLCCGPSGCGKTTLAKLFPDLALADELVAVRRQGQDFLVEALPFWTGRPRRSRLVGVHFLRHGETHSRRPLSAAEAVRRLAREVIWPTYAVAEMGAAFAVLTQLVASLPCFELAFAPRRDVWPVLSGEGCAA